MFSIFAFGLTVGLVEYTGVVGVSVDVATLEYVSIVGTVCDGMLPSAPNVHFLKFVT
jgi:hypothetical protein